MKKIDETQSTATSGQPHGSESFKHIQEGIQENDNSLALATIVQRFGSYTTNDVVILHGCENSTPGGSTYTLSSGAVYYNGEIYQVPAVTFTISGGQTAIGTVTNGYASFDPINFTDNTPHSVHEQNTFVFSAGTSGAGTKDYADCIFITHTDGEITLASQNTTSTSYVNATGLSFTTPNDGKTRKWVITLQGNFSITGGCIGYGGQVQIYNSTTSAELRSSQVFHQVDAGSTFDNHNEDPFWCQYSGSLAPNTTVIVRFKTLSVSFGINIQNIVLDYYERD